MTYKRSKALSDFSVIYVLLVCEQEPAEGNQGHWTGKIHRI